MITNLKTFFLNPPTPQRRLNFADDSKIAHLINKVIYDS